MADHAAATIGKTYDCKTPDCTNPSRSPVGRYSYCDHCRTHREGSTPPAPTTRASVPGVAHKPGFAQTVKDLQAAAKNADKLHAHAVKLTAVALAAKANADAATERVRELARTLTA